MKPRKFQCEEGHEWESIIVLMDEGASETPPACPNCLIQSGVDNRGEEVYEA